MLRGVTARASVSMAGFTAAACGRTARRERARGRVWLIAAIAACILAMPGPRPATARAADATAARVRVEPVDTGVPLVNPGMGWVLYHYDHRLERHGARLAPSDTVDDFPGVSVVSMAVPWSFLEPREGEYDWAVIDTPAQRWIDKGKRIAPRFTCCEPFYEFATPECLGDQRAVAHESRFRLPVALTIEPATYDLFVAVGKPDGTPVIALPLPGHDGHRRYRLGAISVAAKPDGTP